MDQEYKYGFKNDDVSIIKTPKGLNKQVVREISALKNEPDWMLDFRLKALDFFLKSPLPKFGPDLSSLDFNIALISTLFSSIVDNSFLSICNSTSVCESSNFVKATLVILF